MERWDAPDDDMVGMARESAALAEQGMDVPDIVRAVAVSNFEQLTQQEVFEEEMAADKEHPAVQFALGLTPEQEAQAQAEQAEDYEGWESEYWTLAREDADRLEGLAAEWECGDPHLPVLAIGQELGEIISRYPGLLDALDPLLENVGALKEYAYTRDGEDWS